MVLLLWKEPWADSLGPGGQAQPLTTHGAQRDRLLTCALKTSAFTPLSMVLVYADRHMPCTLFSS